MNAEPRKILSLDPATVCGFAHSNGKYGEWNLGKGDGRGEELRERILAAHQAWGVDVIVYELASFGAGASGKRKVQWAIVVLHNELRGAIKGAAKHLGIEAIGYHPTTIKKHTTGSGRADKPQMIRAVKTLYDVETESDNVADAVGLLKLVERGVEPADVVKKKHKRKVKAADKLQPTLFNLKGKRR